MFSVLWLCALRLARQVQEWHLLYYQRYIPVIIYDIGCWLVPHSIKYRTLSSYCRYWKYFGGKIARYLSRFKKLSIKFHSSVSYWSTQEKNIPNVFHLVTWDSAWMWEICQPFGAMLYHNFTQLGQTLFQIIKMKYQQQEWCANDECQPWDRKYSNVLLTF